MTGLTVVSGIIFIQISLRLNYNVSGLCSCSFDLKYEALSSCVKKKRGQKTGRGRRDATVQLCGSRWYSADAGAFTGGFQGVWGWCLVTGRQARQAKEGKRMQA